MIDKIVATIEGSGLSQAAVERMCGLSNSRISKWKDGVGEPTASQILRIADLLKVPVRFLIDDAMTEPAQETDETERRILWIARSIGYERALKRMANADDDASLPVQVKHFIIPGKSAVDVPLRKQRG